MHPFTALARSSAAGALMALAAGSGAAAAQVHPASTTSVTPTRNPPDARPIVERAQESFERKRRSLLPRSYGSAGRCDVRIGRFCYWYDGGGSPGPTEPERITVARRRLLTTLDSAAVADPTDHLVVGQRVRYWLEAGAPGTALAAARECAAAPWWCAALRGWALHEAGDAPGSGAAFDSALAAMPEAERCAWRNLTLLLDEDTRKRYVRLGCAERETIERRFWWLATPFFSRGGNDRRNEHLARMALARLARESSTTYDSRWGDDMEEMLVRYGWADRWSRRDLPPGSQYQGARVIGHEPMPAHQWSAHARLLDDPYAATAADWMPDAVDARERFAAPEARRLEELDASAAAFRRGDSMLVVATWARATERRLAAARASVVLVREEAPAQVTTPRTDSAGGVATALVRHAPHLVSIELLADSGSAARARFAVAPPSDSGGALALSDLLPYRPDGEADSTFDDAVRLALLGNRVGAPERLGIYWEVYGLTDGRHPLETSLSIVAERQGWLERTWRRVRGRAQLAPVNLRWTDLPVATDGHARRAVTIELPSLEEGRYELELQVRTTDGRSGTSSRWLIVHR